LRPQVVFKNTDITHKSELRFLGICMTDNLKWDYEVRLLSSFHSV